MNYIDLRKISLEFRRVSSNLLNSTDDNADVNLSRFLKFINNDVFINDILSQKIEGIEFDFKKCFLIDTGDWATYNIPLDEEEHIKAQYDYMTYIDSSEKTTVRSQALHYSWSDRKINSIIQKFLDKSFKPMIDFINDQISMKMMIMDEERKAVSGNTFIQNIENVNGAANQQVSGTITTYNITNEMTAMCSLIDKIICTLPYLSEISMDDIEIVKDDLEMVQEQIKSSEPKKSRLNKALTGIKRFVKDFSMKLAVSVATKAVTNSDWENLIQQIEVFIEKLT